MLSWSGKDDRLNHTYIGTETTSRFKVSFEGSSKEHWKMSKFVLSRVLLMAYSSILLEYVLDSTYS